MKILSTIMATVVLLLVFPVTAAKNASYVHQKDIVSGYKDGMGLILDVFTPASGQKRNGAAENRLHHRANRSRLGAGGGTADAHARIAKPRLRCLRRHALKPAKIYRP